jgi:hypothetical protein
VQIFSVPRAGSIWLLETISDLIAASVAGLRTGAGRECEGAAKSSDTGLVL